MTLGHTSFLLQFLYSFGRVQVILHKLEATKEQIWYILGSRKSYSDPWHRSPIFGSIWKVLSRKKSGYDGSPSCSDLEHRDPILAFLEIFL